MTGTRWYHGGFPGLKRGQQILPPSATGAPDITSMSAGTDIQDRVERVHRRDRVYIASDIACARLWASLHPAHGGRQRGGDIYEVAPDGPVEPDPDYLADDGMSVQCCSATIVRVVERRVPRPSPEAVAALGGFR